MVFEPVSYAADALEVLQNENTPLVLQAFIASLPESLEPEAVKQQLKMIGKQHKLKPRDVFMPLRCALSGQMHGPKLPSLISLWGKEESIKRVQHSLEVLAGK